MTASPTRHHPPGHPGGPGIPGAVWRMVAGTARILGRLLRGLAALAVLVALVAALPWALWHYIGWPLPGHLPTGDEVVAVLGSPMTTPLLLDVLACLCWIAWAAFVIDVARCVLAAARGLRWPELPTVGPVHAVAAVLVGVIVLSLLGNRGPPGAGAGSTEVTSGHGVLVATAPVHPAVTPGEQPVVVVTAPALTATVTAYPDAPAALAPLAARTVVVRAPENGIHDTLSRIAARTLDDARRWPEIFQANRGKPQPNGGTLTNPNLIFPGERLVLPPDTPAIPLTPAASLPVPVSGGHHDRAPSAVPAPPAPLVPTTPPSPPSRPSTSPHAAPVAAPASSRGSGLGIGWEPGVFVGLSLAAAVSAALLVARRRDWRRYRPGSGRRDDLPVAPVVYQLRLAHLRAEHDAIDPDDSDPDDSGGGGNGPGTGPPLMVVPTAPDLGTPAGGGTGVRVAPGLGVRDGREVALDLAVVCGLGLVGPGAAAAVRALLLAMLAPPPHPGSLRGPASVGAARVIVPAEDLALMLGPEHTHAQLPDAVRVVTDLDVALDELETEILHRAREHHPAPESAWPVIALLARPPAHSTQRLQAVLDNGAHLGLVGIILGQWRPGVSTYIRADGTVSATSPGPGEALKGTRMFHMPHAETVDLLALLRHAQPDTPEAHDGAAVNDIALEVTAISNAEPEGNGPRLVPAPAPPREPGPAPSPAAQDGRQAHHGHDQKPAQRTTAALRCSPVASGHQSGHRDAPTTPIALTVLGRPRVHWRSHPTGEGGAAGDTTVRDITAAFPPRQRELLVFLAVHPDGVHRDALVAALWQDNPPQRSTNALNTALSRLRRSLHEATGGAVGDITTVGEGRYQLDTGLVDVDYWRLCDAVAARRAASTGNERIAAYQQIVNCYSGCLAEGMDTEWIDAAREATRRDAIDAVAALARALVDSDPQHTLDLLETARAFDPHNELLYRDIMRLQERLGQLDAIPRTLTLLGTRLAEIDETPTAPTQGLATRLTQRHDTADADTARTPSRHDHRGDRRGTAAAS